MLIENQVSGRRFTVRMSTVLRSVDPTSSEQQEELERVARSLGQRLLIAVAAEASKIEQRVIPQIKGRGTHPVVRRIALRDKRTLALDNLTVSVTIHVTAAEGYALNMLQLAVIVGRILDQWRDTALSMLLHDEVMELIDELEKWIISMVVTPRSNGLAGLMFLK